MHPKSHGRWGVGLFVASALAVVAAGGTSARTPGSVAHGGDRDTRGVAQAAPVLGAALSILSDGTEPWEDRPLAVDGLGVLPGKTGVADAGDDTGPADRVVRSWDAVVYRASFSVRDAPANDLVAEVTVAGPVVWEESQLAALRLSGCPGGAVLLDGGQRLRCMVGRVDAPPAVTVALDLTARVSGAALQGDVVTAGATVRAPGSTPDPDPANCPVPRSGGCDAAAPDVTVSAAPAAELRKFLLGVGGSAVGGVSGRLLSWRLDAVLGADGDARGTSSPVGAPWVIPDWWRATGRNGRSLALPIRLVACRDVGLGAHWSCAQPGGVGTPLEVTIESLDATAGLPGGVTSSLPQTVGSVELDLWIPEADILATGWDVTFQNCFGTQVNYPGRAVWAPSDARGQPNLGGIAEPLGNNCSHVVLPVPRTNPVPRQPVRPGRPGRPGPPRPPPRVTATPAAEVTKAYTPYTSGDGVTDGTEFAAEVAVRVYGGGEMPRVIACDKWDNSTHALRDDGVAGVRVWWEDDLGVPEVMDPEAVIIEYAKGSWGKGRTSQLNVGRGWYVQATASCADESAEPRPGWVTSANVDFANGGARKIDAADVNMVRARFTDAIPAGTTVWIEILFRAERNPPGTWLMNYGAAAWGTGSRTWHSAECYGVQGSRTRKECPLPAAGSKQRPGPLGDMLVHVGVPLWLRKQNDPYVRGTSPVVNAGQTAWFALLASTYPRPADPPPPVFPPGALAPGVVVTDTLPVGMYYEPGSATVASEDLNGNGRLDPGEDGNGNGRIDRDVAFEPAIRDGPSDGETTLVWRIGDLPYQVTVPTIRYRARISRLVRGGASLDNWAGVSASNDRAPGCWQPAPGDPLGSSWNGQDRSTGRCAWAQVIVANIAAAQVEKVARVPSVLPGEPLTYRLALANLTNRPVEWFDAVDILPRAGEPRDPETRLAGGLADVQAAALSGGPPLEVWASAVDPDVLDTAGGGLRDGIVDPVTAWSGGETGGIGLGGTQWPCRLSDVGTRRCSAIASRGAITAIRLWGPDPQPNRSGNPGDSFLPAGGAPRYVDVTLSVVGSTPGDLAHNAWGGRFESLPLPVFDDAVIRVRPPNTPTATVTDTPGPPTATATATTTPPPTSTATVTPTTTPTSTSTPRPVHPIYLPMSLRLPCWPRPVDVALVIDMSSSMLRDAGDGGTKQAAVMRAAWAFLDRFAPGDLGGRVAIVAFNDRAWIQQPLTSDAARIDAALGALPRQLREGTRLDLGLQVGASALGGVEPGRWRALVLLTDGMPNWVPTPRGGGTQDATVLSAAADVRSRGIAVYTVAYGREDAEDLADRISPDLMKAVAGAEERYYQTDDAAVLADVFRRIAASLGCEGQGTWP